MKILLLCIHWYIAPARLVYRAFRRLGHDVRSMGPDPQRPGIPPGFFYWPPTYTVAPDMMNGPIIDANEVQRLCGDWQPDIVITLAGGFTMRGDLGCPHVRYALDVEALLGDKALPPTAYDATFWVHKNDARHWGGRWLPCGFDPRLHRPRRAATIFDAAMLGNMYAGRQAVMDALRDAGLYVIYGYGFTFHEYADLYSLSRAAVCQSRIGNIDQRIFEGMAMGCVIVSDRRPGLDELGIVAEEHYLPFCRPEEAVALCMRLRDDEAEAAALSQAGRGIVAPHTWDARCAELLTTIFGEGNETT